MSSNASSSGIESDTDSSPSLQEEKDHQTVSDSNDESIDTLINDNDDEGFLETTTSTVMLDTMKQRQIHQTPSNSIFKEPCRYPYSTRNPYDDDTTSSSAVEDWDEECQVTEPYHFPSYIRRAQWPNHWRWTPPLGIRRTCTQRLHRDFGFERTGLYDDLGGGASPSHVRFRFNF